MQHDVQSVFTAPFVLSFSSFFSSPLFTLCLFGKTLGLFDPFTVASLFGCPSGCSPDSSTPSRRPHVWSAVHTDPPCVFPPCHVSIRHIIFVHWIRFLLCSNAFLLRCNLFCSFVPFLGLDFSFFSSLPLSTHFFLLLFLSPFFLFLRILQLSCLLRSLLLLSRVLRSPLFLHAPPALSLLPLLSSRVHFLLSALNPVVSHSSASFAQSLALFLSLSPVLSFLPPVFRRPHSQPISFSWSLFFLGPTWPGGVSHQPPC